VVPNVTLISFVKASYPARVALSRRSTITLECFVTSMTWKRFDPRSLHPPGWQAPSARSRSAGRHPRLESG
jgi:hypothetical protein